MVGPEGGKESLRDAMYPNLIMNFIGTRLETRKRDGPKVSANPVSTHWKLKCHRIVTVILYTLFYIS